MDVDQKFKKGIVLTLEQWRKVIKGLGVIDRKIKAKKLEMAARNGVTH